MERVGVSTFILLISIRVLTRFWVIFKWISIAVSVWGGVSVANRSEWCDSEPIDPADGPLGWSPNSGTWWRRLVLLAKIAIWLARHCGRCMTSLFFRFHGIHTSDNRDLLVNECPAGPAKFFFIDIETRSHNASKMPNSSRPDRIPGVRLKNF